MILNVEGIPEAISVLTKEGFSLLNDEELYNLQGLTLAEMPTIISL
jgi:hypothetical protein